MTQCFVKNDVDIPLYPPKSPDLDMCDMELYLKIKPKLKGRRFDKRNCAILKTFGIKFFVVSTQKNYFS